MSLMATDDDINSIDLQQSSLDLQQSFQKKVSFRDDVTGHSSDSESSSSQSSEETFLPSVSSISDCSDDTDTMMATMKKSSSSRSFNNSDTRDVKNVLKKRYSKLAFSVQGVREGNMKRSGSARRLKK